jgi:lipopolysaccharide/colanic/teichoic acid biosynthesis glycosyltransferase
MSAEERISLDIKYAEQHSFLMDLKILLKTIPAMIQKESV